MIAPLIRDLFDLYASGTYSIRSLQVEMAARGLVNAGGKPLTKTGIETVLGNPFYCGLMRVGRTGEVFEGCHEPLISATLFDHVQSIKHGKYQKQVRRHHYTYRRLFRCGLCASAMIPERQKGHVYYRCQTRTCATKCVREEALEVAIQARLSDIVLTNEEFAVATERIRGWASGRREAMAVKRLELEMVRHDTRLDTLTDALLDNLIDKETYTKRKAGLLVDRAKLQEQLELACRQGDLTQDADRFLERVRNLKTSHEMGNPDEKREIVEIAISNRSV